MRSFLDTNILVYAFTDDRRTDRARALLAGESRISVQSLNEFALAARRKLGLSWDVATSALNEIRGLCPAPHPLTIELHEIGLRLAQRHQFKIYDAMIVAAALATKCDTLWSEDMHDGLLVDGRLTIRNPFV